MTRFEVTQFQRFEMGQGTIVRMNLACYETADRIATYALESTLENNATWEPLLLAFLQSKKGMGILKISDRAMVCGDNPEAMIMISGCGIHCEGRGRGATCHEASARAVVDAFNQWLLLYHKKYRSFVAVQKNVPCTLRSIA